MAIGEQQVIVIGAGVSGLTSAICLAEAGWPVRVWAAALPQQTTSAVAGAVWGPRPKEPVAKVRGWIEQSLHVFRDLAKDPATGVRMTPALSVGDRIETGAMPPGLELIPDVRPADPADVPGGFRAGFHATLPMIDMPQYLDCLTQRLAATGCEIETRPLRSLAEAAEAAPIVINCAGLGARELAGDATVWPRFGQHVVLTNPGLEKLFIERTGGSEWICYFAHPQRVVCGGISIPGRWDPTPEPEITERILQRCRRIQPRLAEAAVIETITGLRPDRPSVRVEAEPIGRALCIHNYGHGGDGVTLSWGCAREVVNLVGGG
ncbi:d-amino acid oxidase Aao [Mycobacterium tuberculosis UT0016]|uniref:D-amino-acid oxidase n=1 Tax=Mycobacterium tuberculosis TaxID=1773 RepID=A0A0T9VKF8_MYCTX|nr:MULTISPECIES: FAD-dependent oxidoreductase [Mycobacterium]ASZ22244.1 D-amino-acid oxidase [Mycobacterium tuberculosis]ASZ26337.1 D-amino-acid oxidase [Mycobacterium tuberculosis]AVV88045.1 D-amino-acid oxidase [Mycobacterium tuberculosis]KAL11685.1 d-amino acid oxidase Aao [Mycobacterium tuberculosis UT0026]KAR49814.1 d-amino acid oxidase Aao [Mycobacterium tuberculosis TKK_03_0037]